MGFLIFWFLLLTFKQQAIIAEETFIAWCFVFAFYVGLKAIWLCTPDNKEDHE